MPATLHAPKCLTAAPSLGRKLRGGGGGSTGNAILQTVSASGRLLQGLLPSAPACPGPQHVPLSLHPPRAAPFSLRPGPGTELHLNPGGEGRSRLVGLVGYKPTPCPGRPRATLPTESGERKAGHGQQQAGPRWDIRGCWVGGGSSHIPCLQPCPQPRGPRVLHSPDAGRGGSGGDPGTSACSKSCTDSDNGLRSKAACPAQR